MVRFYLTTILLLASFSVSAQTYSPCIDPASDFDGDGWGYENGQSCTVSQGQVSAPVGNNAGSCIDDNNDGWGWNGVASCRVQNAIVQATQCIDDDGDGWGWNGVESCVVTAVVSQVQEQPVGTEQPTNTQQPTEPETPVVVQSVPAVSTAQNCSVVLSAGENIYNAVSRNLTKICLRPGDYFLPQTLSLKSNQILAGFNPSDQPRLNTSAVRTIATTGQSNVVIEDLIIDGNGTGAVEFAILVGNGSRNIRIENVIVENTFGIGIGMTNVQTVNIIDSTVRNIGLSPKLRQAIWMAFGSRDVTVDGLTVRGRENDQSGGDHAVTCISGSGWTVTNSRSDYAGSSAIAANDCDDVVFTNNQLSNGREFGVDIVNNAVGVLVANNTITGFDRAAMVFDDHDWQCSGCGNNPSEVIVDNNTMRNNNTTNLGPCKGVAVDSGMQINSTNGRWIRITDSNTVDSNSTLFCDHIH